MLLNVALWLQAHWNATLLIKIICISISILSCLILYVFVRDWYDLETQKYFIGIVILGVLWVILSWAPQWHEILKYKSRIFIALGLIMIIAYVVLYCLRPATKTVKFDTVIFFDNKKFEPIICSIRKLRAVDDIRAGRLEGVWENSISKYSEKEKKKSILILRDFLAREVVEILAWQHENTWLDEIEILNLPNIKPALKGLPEDLRNIKNEKYIYSHRMEIAVNDIYKKLEKTGNRMVWVKYPPEGPNKNNPQMYLPPGTDFNIPEATQTQQSTQFLLRNPYVTVRILISKLPWSGPLTEDYYDFKVNEAKDNYSRFFFRIEIKADFVGFPNSLWLSGIKQMQYQRQWVDSIVEILRQHLDWEPCSQEIKDEWMEKQLRKD